MIERFSVSAPKALLNILDQFMQRSGYQNRSEAIRDLIRGLAVEEEWKGGKHEVVGTITLVYSHDAHDLADKLTDIQHSHYKSIISTTHIHLDAHNCLETLVVRGKAKKVKEIADRLISSKGVKHGKLVTATTGKELV
ncbi:MAG: CopG family transcriptional regulator nickel-responsive regulator [Candidatus Saganbacteria bacterium]|uniref:Putative nickel-responsive regulator n=1 Tax=Candidatus Saganbacteria bacterium TaxID=2575572 RepID=A0A833KZZ9_UNCSA|nr:MAG: CopG family transcriptional regulator nickel-responsive regulator [Candidatus Saganbacteria bacterium]